jgi:hypothetical protein
MVNNNTYLIPSGSGLSKYLDDIKKFPMLSLEKEYSLAKAWVEEGCRSSFKTFLFLGGNSYEEDFTGYSCTCHVFWHC